MPGGEAAPQRVPSEPQSPDVAAASRPECCGVTGTGFSLQRNRCGCIVYPPIKLRPYCVLLCAGLSGDKSGKQKSLKSCGLGDGEMGLHQIIAKKRGGPSDHSEVKVLRSKSMVCLEGVWGSPEGTSGLERRLQK